MKSIPRADRVSCGSPYCVLVDSKIGGRVVTSEQVAETQKNAENGDARNERSLLLAVQPHMPSLAMHQSGVLHAKWLAEA